MSLKSLTEIKRAAPETLLAKLKVDSPHGSAEAGQALLAVAKQYGLELRDFLRLAIDPMKSERKDDFTGLNGYEASLLYLGLPFRDDFDNGVVLDLASDTFQTYPGTRAMFPEVIDDLVQWKYRQDQIEKLAPMLAQTRTISGTELLTTLVNDAAADYKMVRPVTELANMPVWSIRTTEQSVKMWKIGGGYRTSYEFTRRARLDIMTPYAARINRELERSKVELATSVLINGDGVQPAAGSVNQSSFNGGPIGTSTNGTLSYKHLIAWLVARAKVGTPVDTVVGNWDAYIQWLMLFAIPSVADGPSAARNMAAAGFQIGGVPILSGTVNFVISSAAPANKLIGYSKADTLEELQEAGSMISESERAVLNQAITYVKSEVSGFRIVFPDTRGIFDFGA